MPNAATEAIISFSGQDKGLLRVLDASTKRMRQLSSATEAGINSFSAFEDSASLTQAAIDSVGKSAVGRGKNVLSLSRTATGGYRDMTNAADKTIAAADVMDDSFLGLGSRVLGISKEFKTVNSVLQPTAGMFGEVADQTTMVGKGFKVLDLLEKPLVSGLKTVSNLTEGLAESVKLLGPEGEQVAQVLYNQRA